MRATTASSFSHKFLTAITMLAMMLAALPVMPASAASITVNTTADEYVDNATCSLREAIIAANNNTSSYGCVLSGSGVDDIITLQSGTTYTLTRVGASETTGDLDVGVLAGDSGNLTIQASGTTNAIIDANDINRVFEVGSVGNVNLTLNHITVTNGNSPDGAGIYFGGGGALTLMNSTVSSNVGTGVNNCGAGIYNDTLATINIVNSIVEGNTCTDVTATADGAGLFKGAGGTLTITGSTFYNNTTPDNGGGARIDMETGTASITNSTFVGNVAGSKGGAIQVNSGTVSVEFSTFSNNAANSAQPSTGGAIQSDGGAVTVTRSILANSLTNLAAGKDCDQLAPGTVTVTNSLVETNSDCTGSMTSGDPALGALANNGGTTPTMAIDAGSPAFNAALSCGSITTDQRGVVTRPQGAACDLGAFEFATGPVIPGPATLVSPSGSTSDNTPTYTWNSVSGATWYYLWVNGPSGVVLQQWYTSAEANCSGGTCSVTPSLTLSSGAHTWWIMTYGDGGDGPWSSGKSFTVTSPGVPGKATLLSPNGSTADTTPTYTWNPVSGATWYYLWVNGPSGVVLQQWFTAAEANCSGGTCSVTPSQALSPGAHTWWIMTYNSAGDGPWSDAMNFTVTAPVDPRKATLLSPSGSTNDSTPTYTWNQVTGATWYYLWVNGPSGNVIQQWYTAAEASCNGTTCSVTPTTALGSGAHTWWIMTYDAAGDGPWSDGMSFTLP